MSSTKAWPKRSGWWKAAKVATRMGEEVLRDSQETEDMNFSGEGKRAHSVDKVGREEENAK